MKIQAVRGFKDWLPEEFVKYNYLIETARSFLRRANFREIKLPILERTELFVRSIGEVTDIVQKETYTFQDKNQDWLTLRPEATAGICRMFIEEGLHVRPKPIKLFTIGPMFRHERPQKGRLREFYQIDVEFFGNLTPHYEVELLDLAMTILRHPLHKREEAEEGPFLLEINSLGCPECRPSYREYLLEALSRVRDELCKTCQERLLRNPLRVLDCKEKTCKEKVQTLIPISDFWCDTCKSHFEALRELLDLRGLSYKINPLLVRGLDYYVRTIFEIKGRNLGAQDTVCAGGRYDYLLRDLGGPDIPAIGFAIGLERWALVIYQENEALGRLLENSLNPELFFIPLGEEARRRGLEIVRDLRISGYQVEALFEERSLKAMMREADRSGAKLALILGSEELSQERILVKNLKTGIQEILPLSDLKTYLAGVLRSEDLS